MFRVRRFHRCFLSGRRVLFYAVGWFLCLGVVPNGKAAVTIPYTGGAAVCAPAGGSPPREEKSSGAAERKPALWLPVSLSAAAAACCVSWVLYFRILRTKRKREKELGELLARRYDSVRTVARVLYEYGSPETACRQLRRLLSPECGGGLLDEIEPTVDTVLGSALTELKRRMPSVDGRDGRLLCMLCCGFTAQEISSITGDSVPTVYKRKSRLKRRLVESGLSCAGVFLKIMG